MQFRHSPCNMESNQLLIDFNVGQLKVAAEILQPPPQFVREVWTSLVHFAFFSYLALATDAVVVSVESVRV
jgi:hypothetical protein